MERTLKDVVGQLLKEKNRSLAWLAREMEKTDDGMRLSLVKGSLKYNDIVRLSQILGIEPTVLFDREVVIPDEPLKEDTLEEENCREMVEVLKSQIKDKEQIIELLLRKK